MLRPGARRVVRGVPGEHAREHARQQRRRARAAGRARHAALSRSVVSLRGMETAAVPRPARAELRARSPTRPRRAGVDAPVPSCPGWTVDRSPRALRGRRRVGADDRRAGEGGQHRPRGPRRGRPVAPGRRARRGVPRRARRRCVDALASVDSRHPGVDVLVRPTAPRRSGSDVARRRPPCTATTPSSPRARRRRSTPRSRSTASTSSSPCSCPRLADNFDADGRRHRAPALHRRRRRVAAHPARRRGRR